MQTFVSYYILYFGGDDFVHLFVSFQVTVNLPQPLDHKPRILFCVMQILILFCDLIITNVTLVSRFRWWQPMISINIPIGKQTDSRWYLHDTQACEINCGVSQKERNAKDVVSKCFQKCLHHNVLYQKRSYNNRLTNWTESSHHLRRNITQLSWTLSWSIGRRNSRRKHCMVHRCTSTWKIFGNACSSFARRSVLCFFICLYFLFVSEFGTENHNRNKRERSGTRCTGYRVSSVWLRAVWISEKGTSQPGLSQNGGTGILQCCIIIKRGLLFFRSNTITTAANGWVYVGLCLWHYITKAMQRPRVHNKRKWGILE